MIPQELYDPNQHKRFRKIYDAFCGRVYNYAMSITENDTILSEEITQTVFVKLWEHFDELENVQAVLSYLFTSVKRTFLNYLEHKNTKDLYMDYILTHQGEVVTEAEEKQEAQSLENHLMNIVSHMPPMRQKVFTMSRIQNISNKQIAEQLHISQRTVEDHISLAIKELRKHIND